MTKSEFKVWKARTEESCGKWTVDEVHAHNYPGELIFYKGDTPDGVEGDYVMLVELIVGYIPGWQLSFGNYCDAIPHIGEAVFTPKWKKVFTGPSARTEAWKYLIERGKMRDLQTMVLGKNYLYDGITHI